jgi:hypothetical protein
MSQRNRLKPYLAYLETLGVQVESVTSTGNSHLKIAVTSKGSPGFFIIANSTSDCRSFLNWKCDVRRWLQKKEDRHDQAHESFHTR